MVEASPLKSKSTKDAARNILEIHSPYPDEPTSVTYKGGRRPTTNWYGSDKAVTIENFKECVKGTSEEVCAEHFEPPESYDPYFKKEKKPGYRKVVMQPHPHTVPNILYEPPEKLFDMLYELLKLNGDSD